MRLAHVGKGKASGGKGERRKRGRDVPYSSRRSSLLGLEVSLCESTTAFLKASLWGADMVLVGGGGGVVWFGGWVSCWRKSRRVCCRDDQSSTLFGKGEEGWFIKSGEGGGGSLAG